MEMMDMRAATVALDNCRVALEGIGKLVLQDFEISQSDPEMEARRISLQHTLKTVWRNSSFTAMAVYTQIIVERKLLLNFPDELTDLLVASNGLQDGLKEAKKTLRKIDPTFAQKTTGNEEKPKNPTEENPVVGPTTH